VTRPVTARHDRGFTLVELMVALFLFAMIATAAVAAMTFSLQAEESLSAREAAIGRLETAHAVMKADFAQAVARPAREPLGALRRPDTTARDDALIVTLVRRGWTNPGRLAARGSLQQVDYRLEEGRLIRRSWARANPARETPVYDQVLLENVTSADFFIRSGTRWQEVDTITFARTGALPPAVAFEMETADFGRLRQQFLTTGGRR
jgi:general secretion pathway protein J